jgi:hypothetical protein
MIILFSAIALLLGIYLYVNKTSRNSTSDTSNINKSSDASKTSDSKPPKVAAEIEETPKGKEERLLNIKNPDIEKPFAKMSVPTPVEVHVIQSVSDEPQEVVSNDVAVSEVNEIVASVVKPPRKPRQPRTPKPKTDGEIENKVSTESGEAPKKKRRKKKPSKPKTDENTTK